MSESPTRQLADEHEYVKLVVGAMEAEATFIERTGRIHEERVIQMVDFTRNFTDGDHHTKEEDLLFPAARGAECSRRRHHQRPVERAPGGT